ncbi:MAG: excisionase family DNA binding protein [Cognaticolwellia sp.]
MRIGRLASTLNAWHLLEANVSNTAQKLEASLTPIGVPEDQREAVARLLEFLQASPEGDALHLVAGGGSRGDVPAAVAILLGHIVETLASGQSVALVPVSRELTTQQAADLLNLSRQYLVRQLDAGVLPFRMTGTHRRLSLEDVLAYKTVREQGRRQSLNELSELTQAFEGYDELERAD